MSIAGNFSLKVDVARLIKASRHDEAISKLDDLVTQEGPTAFAHWLKAWCLDAQGSPETASAEAEKALALDEDHFESLKLLADIHHRSKDYEKAKYFVLRSLKSYEDGSEKPPSWPIDLALRALSFLPHVKRFRDVWLESVTEDKEYAQWAAGYLRWYEVEFGNEKQSAH